MDFVDILNSFTRTRYLQSTAKTQLISIYGVLASTLLSSYIGLVAAPFYLISSTSIIYTFLGIILLTLGAYFIPPTKSNLSLRIPMLWCIGGLSGSIMRFLFALMAINETILFLSILASVALFVGFAIATMCFNRNDVVSLVGSGMMIASVFGLAELFIPMSVSMHLLGGLATECLIVSHHTNVLLDQAAMGIDLDPVTHALGFFQEILHMTLRLGQLFNDNTRENREREQNREQRQRRRARATQINTEL